MPLSIIIPSYNTKEILRRCLESIKKEERGIGLETIVVDNGSDDGSVEMIKKDFPAVKLICNSENLGFSRAVNQGIKASSGKVVFLLNSDTRLTRGSLKKLLELEKRVGPAIIGAKMINPDGSPQPSVFHLPSLKRAILEYWLGRTGYFSKYLPPADQPVEVEAVSGGAMLISQPVFEKVGLLDERYFFYFEDLDFCRKAAKAGFKIYFFPRAQVIHEHGASGRNLADCRNQWRRLIPSSKIYYGALKHYLINFIIWSGQKWRKRT